MGDPLKSGTNFTTVAALSSKFGWEFFEALRNRDERMATNVPGIWAIGDVVRGPMLAHKVSRAVKSFCLFFIF